MSAAYEPATNLASKISRRVTPFLSRRMLKVSLNRPLVSFTFDDCPVSAISNGVKPLENLGWQSTIYVACGLLGQTNHHGLQINKGDLAALDKAGHEIGGHTFSHVDAQSCSLPDYLADIHKNQAQLKALNIKLSRTFAYPYGQTTPAVKLALGSEFEGMRGIQSGAHASNVDLNQIKSIPLFSGEAITSAIKALSKLRSEPGWVTFFTHDIQATPSPWGCTPEEFQQVIRTVQEINAEVLPVHRAIDYLRTNV